MVKVFDTDSGSEKGEDDELGINPHGIDDYALYALCWAWFVVAASCFTDVYAVAFGNHHVWTTAVHEVL